MRQRITYLQSPQDSIDPGTLSITKSSISTPHLKAAREERITFGFDELPQELYSVLKAAHELHVRWVSERPYEAIAPFVSRLSPGLHVFYTPQRNSNTSTLLCPMLKKAFGEMDCESPEESFTTLPIERFSHSAALQYYTPLSNLTRLSHYLTHKLCNTLPASQQNICHSRLFTLSSSAYLDISFDTISHALTLTTFHSSTTQSLSLSTTPGSSRLEVGILATENALELEELSLGGFLTVVGEDSKPSPTLFSFPSRHHPLSPSSHFTAGFKHPTGLHPTLELNISDLNPPMSDRACALHAHLTLPKEVFADKYQLSDTNTLFLSSHGLKKLHYITSPIDLEAPAYTLPLWGSSLLIELSPSSPSSSSKSSTSTSQSSIPLHLRYLAPNTAQSGIQKLEFPYPVLFWACTADEGSKFPINPFDRVNLGYEGLFGPRTLFWHLEPEAVSDGRLVSGLEVPVLDLDRSGWVERGTAVVVGLGLLWVLWCLWGVFRDAGFGSEGKGVGRGKKEN